MRIIPTSCKKSELFVDKEAEINLRHQRAKSLNTLSSNPARSVCVGRHSEERAHALSAIDVYHVAYRGIRCKLKAVDMSVSDLVLLWGVIKNGFKSEKVIFRRYCHNKRTARLEGAQYLV